MIQLPSEQLVVVVGHYGTGKTNFALNLACTAKEQGKNVTLVDLDVVNPYFRSSEYAEILQNQGINIVMPVLAQSSVDVPSLSAGVYGAIETVSKDNNFVVLDVGGDDVGATALARFAPDIKAIKYRMFYVINERRNLTASPTDAITVLQEIESACTLKATDLVANTHLKQETTYETIRNAFDFHHECSRLLNLPIWATCVSVSLLNRLNAGELDMLENENLYPVKVRVKTNWE